MSIASLLLGKKSYHEDAFLQNRAPIRSVPLHLLPFTQRKIEGNHIYLEAGEGPAIIFCHGLFGGIFNIDIVWREIARDYRIIMPYLPMYDMALKDCTIQKLGDYLSTFVADLQLDKAVVIGNSMGGATALHYALKPTNKLKGLVLCGASGLSNIPLNKGYFHRKNFHFVQESVRDIFYDRSIPPDAMVQDVFDAIQSNETVMRSVRLTRSVTKHPMHTALPGIETPALLVWGKQDPITPVEVAPVFEQLMPHASLRIIDRCGHVPQQEKPYSFLEFFTDFMNRINY
jgi:pimeloyl-ACP methyl ester carboxylesterase